jgi:ribosomal protein L34
MRLCRPSKILRKERSGFRQKATARKGRALTPSKRLKLSAAGPMVLHAPSVWERRSSPALNKGQSEKSDWPFPLRGDPVEADLRAIDQAAALRMRQNKPPRSLPPNAPRRCRAHTPLAIM